MKVDTFNQPNFKSLYVDDCKFNKRESMLVNDISKKLLGGYKPDDNKVRTWNKWLKDEKGIDIYIKRAKNTKDMLTVFGVKNANNIDEARKLKNFFVVGDYYTTDFEPEDVMASYKGEKQANALALGALILVGLGFIGAFLFYRMILENNIGKKEIPQKVIQMKDSIADSLKVFKLNDMIKKSKLDKK